MLLTLDKFGSTFIAKSRQYLLLACAASLVLMPAEKVYSGGEEGEFGFGFFFSDDSSDDADASVKKTEALRPIVSIGHFKTQSVPTEISVFGVAEPQYQQKLIVESAGRISSLSPKLDPGMYIKKGDEVAVIEDSNYQTAYANAEQAVAASELSLLQEVQRSKQAQLNWERAQVSNGEPNALALRKPFLKLERLKLKAAKAALIKAKRDLKNTRIVMPFDGVVISRTSTPSAYVSTGSEIAEIYSTEQINVEVKLSEKQWRLLMREDGKPIPAARISAKIKNEAGLLWNADVVSEGAVVDSTTRQQSLRLRVNPRNVNGEVLKPGAFVKVTLTGQEIDNVLYLPASAVTLNGNIWAVSDNPRNTGQLERFSVTPLLSQNNMIAIDASELPLKNNWKIVINPISRYLPGQLVNVREVSM